MRVCVCPQAEKLSMELSTARDELSRRLAAASDGADAMLANAAGAMNMLNVRLTSSHTTDSHGTLLSAQCSL